MVSVKSVWILHCSVARGYPELFHAAVYLMFPLTSGSSMNLVSARNLNIQAFVLKGIRLPLQELQKLWNISPCG